MSNLTLSGAIVLRWRNRNILDIDGTNIYRSESPMDKDNLPEPYDFVEGSSEEFADSNVEYGKTYYYKIGTVKGDEELITDGHVVYSVGGELREPFDLSAYYYEDEPENSKPFDLSARYDKYITRQ